MKLKYSILLILGFALLVFFIPTISWGSIDCCYHECRLTDSPKCDGNWVQTCGNCDIDPYQDWCNQTNCATGGKVCQNGACVGSACSVNCLTVPGCLNSLANGMVTSGECCGSGNCYQCRAGYSWDSVNNICKVSSVPVCSDGTSYSQCSSSSIKGQPWYCNSSGNLVQNSGLCKCRNNWVPGPDGTYCCDHQCNASCSNVGCTAAQDPDCGSAGCCGDHTCNTSETNANCPADCAIVTCTAFTYSAWSACVNGSHIRTVLTSSPTGCTGGTRVITQTCDSLKPEVDSFTVSTGPTIAWEVTDTGGSHLARVEVWRAPDVSGSHGTFAEVSRQDISALNTDHHTGSATDNPGPGSWWYGIHAVDQANNWVPEATPVNIVITVSSLPAIPTNANAICIYNKNDATSTAICNYYLGKDQRSGASKYGLDVPDSIFIKIPNTTWQYKEWSTLADFLIYIKKPLDDYLAEHSELKITHVAVAKGLPIRVTMQIIPPSTYFDQVAKKSVTIKESYMSNTVALEKELDYSLCAIIDEACSKKLYNKDSRVVDLLPEFADEFLTYQSARTAHFLEHFDAAEYQSFRLGVRPKYVSSNLNGYNLEDIKKMIDRAQAPAPDLLKAKWVADGDIKNYYWPEEHATVYKFLITAGISSNNIILEKTNTIPLDLTYLTDPLVGYYSAGDHSPGYSFDWALNKVRAPVANRAIITSYESFNGYTFSLDPYHRDDKGSDQSIPSDMISSIAFGGTDYLRSFSGGYGNVYEPGLIGTDHAEDFFLSYASGMTLAEAFFNTWESPHNIAWGDPLMRITDDSTDNRKPNGMACASNSECRSGSECLANDLGFKFCFTLENGSCLFSRPGYLNPGLRMYNILAPNGKVICEDAPSAKSLATLTCSNSQWRATVCAPGRQCAYTTTPNDWNSYLASSYAGAGCKLVDGQECSTDANCANHYCDADMSGVKRCHSTASSCAGGEAGNEASSGSSVCTTDLQKKVQCNNAVWSSQIQCQNGCRFNSCVEDLYNPATHTFNLMPEQGYILTLPVNTGSKKISEVFSNALLNTIIVLWDNQTKSWLNNAVFENDKWVNGDIIIKPGEPFYIQAPANFAPIITGIEFSSVVPFRINNTKNFFGVPYCAEKYTASKLIREISAIDSRCVAISTADNEVDPVFYWSDVQNHGITGGGKYDFKILPFEGYYVKCTEGVDFIFTPACAE